MFSKKYEIKYYEQNHKGFVKESALLNILQDIATESAEELGFGPSFVFSNNYAWVVLKYHIELFGEIKNLPYITLTTEPRGITKLYAFRDFAIYSPNGEKIGAATSCWALIDGETRRMLSLQKTLPMMFPFEKRETDLIYEKFDLPDTHDFIKEFNVRFDDVDVNEHANNSNYVVWALETLPYDYRNSHRINTMDIKYRKETTYGHSVISETKHIADDNVTIHLLKDKDNNEELCCIKIF